ncbi:MAG: PTS sugar transporter subunit IIA [Pseudomonadota bacterium]
MTIPTSLLNGESIILDALPAEKDELIESIALLLEDSDLSPQTISTKLHAREELGSTALGYGIALPHARMQGIQAPRAIFMRLSKSVDFDAPDEEPVDIIFAMLVPAGANEEYLRLLASLAKMFNDPETREQLRSASTRDEIHTILTGIQHRKSA